jgi:hypothetical protein
VRGAGAAALTACLLLSGLALADDLVFLKNGGRIRGTVMSEAPKRGVECTIP